MGIYIKGMDMPKDGELLCVNIYPDGKVCINLDLECKRIATAVPVPAHGDLIDRDVLLSEYPEPSNYLGTDGVVFHIAGIRASIESAPTIIPAESEGE